MGQNKGPQDAKATLDVIAAWRQLQPDCVLVDKAGRAWTAEDLEYTLLDQLRNKRWRSCPATLLPDGIYGADAKGQPGERLYLLSEAVMTSK